MDINTKNSEDSIYNSLRSVRSDIKTDRNEAEIKSLTNRVFVAETILKAMCRILKKQGVSMDELNAEIQAIMNERKTNYNTAPRYSCPRCAKTMQLSSANPFLATCMYCGANKSIMPFGLDDENGSEPVKAEEKPQEEKGFDDLFDSLY